MILTLEVTGPQALEMGAGNRKVFKAIGGTIGRLPDNDWVFPDPYVSGRHALIRYLNGKYFIEDTSTNGVFVNSPDNRLSRSQPQQLRDGDVLYIDAYKIQVSLQNDPAAQARNDPFAGLKHGGPRVAPPAPARRPPAAPAAPAEDKTASLAMSRKNDSDHGVVVADFDENFDIDSDDDDGENEADDHGTQWFKMGDMAEPKRAPIPADPEARVRSEPPRPAVAPPPRPLTRRPPPPTASTPAHARQPRRSDEPGADAELRALLAAAGIEGLNPSAETAATLGEILRIAMGGVMEALRTRERIKDDLRMRGTTFKAADNNPLKFSANVDDAFHNLLVKHNPAYLKPADAVDEAFRDVREHQAAFLAAMRLAFESMLSQFDPQRLQEEFDRQMKGSILGVPAKLRYWDLYRDKYGDLIRDAESGFRTLFGDAFARAYEEHLERHKKPARPAG